MYAAIQFVNDEKIAIILCRQNWIRQSKKPFGTI